MSELKDLFSEYLDYWYLLVSQRTKYILATATGKSKEELDTLSSNINNYKSKLDEIEKTLSKSQFVISVPFKNFVDNFLLTLQRESSINITNALSNQSGELYEKVMCVNGLIKFLHLKKSTIVALNVLSNVMLPLKEKSLFSSFIRQDVKTHKTLQSEELNKLIIELGFFVDDKNTLVSKNIPVVYTNGKHAFICTDDDLKKLKKLDVSIKSVIDKMQEQIALAKVGSADMNKYEKYQLEYLELKNEKEKLLSNLKEYQKQNE